MLCLMSNISLSVGIFLRCYLHHGRISIISRGGQDGRHGARAGHVSRVVQRAAIGAEWKVATWWRVEHWVNPNIQADDERT